MMEPGVIAITGLGSFLGERLVERLLLRNPKLRIIGIDRRSPYGLDDRVRFVRLDLTEPTVDSRLADILQTERVEALVHAAFRTNPSADLEMDHEFETIGSLYVMNACAEAKVKRLVVASSTML